MGFTLFPLATKTMKLLPKNWLSQNKLPTLKQKVIVSLLLLFSFLSKGQVVNYVNNGGFEIANPNNTQKPKYWDATDTNDYMGLLLSQTITPYLVPTSSFTHQWPVSGSNYLLSNLLWKPNTPNTSRRYPRNEMKQSLQLGKVYCIQLYVNVTDQSSYGVDGFGVFFGDTSTDTIKKCSVPLTYLTPQIQYTSGFIFDTLNWMKISGTFTASGTEKYLMLGNFKSDATTNTVMVNPTNSVVVFCDVLYDNVSVIDIDLPAFAGRDTFFIPGDSVYLGRPSDVGIDEACMWYKLPNTTTAIDTVAGLWVKPVTTTTYVVKQEICGVIKWDTVVLYQSAIGVHELDIISNNLKIYPQPVTNEVNIQLNLQMDAPFNKYQLYNNFGQLIREEELSFKNHIATITFEDLANGVYFISISNLQNETITKKLVITK